MTEGFSEDTVEFAGLDWFGELGYEVLWGPDIAPEGANPERISFGDVILLGRLRKTVRKLNPGLDDETLEQVVSKVSQSDTPSLFDENRRLHKLLIDGVDLDITHSDGTIGGKKFHLIDFDKLHNNDWLVVNQFTVIENQNNRRPDMVVFVNGLPLGVIELKNTADESATLEGAYHQLQTYKKEIPSLFRTNEVLITSDGILARIGSLTADSERFMPWRTVDGTGTTTKGLPEMGTLIEGVFEKERFLDYIRGFVVFENDGERLIKKIAGYHQFHAVRHAIESTVEAARPDGDRKAGVIWHTQGSGKSLLMAFYAGRIIAHPDMKNPTLVVITDRNDLDDQLFGTFSGCKDLFRQTPVQANDREHLKQLLSVASGGVIFTTVQKFQPEKGEAYPALTDRENVVVIADEAHRSQYGFKAKIDQKSGVVTYGFAKHMNDALPNASFIGFTGTPIESTDVNTPAVFGDYIDIYDIQRAVDDGATVPIYYESRLAKIELEESEKPRIDSAIEALVEDKEEGEAEQLKGNWAQVERLVGSEKRLEIIARDLVDHFEARIEALQGKAMIVCMSRRICVDLYDQIVKLRPDWHSDDEDKGAIKVVMTGAASDPESWQKHVGNKSYRERLAKRIKKADDPLKIVIVRDMWLTGFDAPSMHTMYVDKPMRGHGLMQAIARVNRVFKDKPGGLIVDYIGLAQNLKTALAQYSEQDQEITGIDESEAVAVMREKYEVLRDFYHGFDYQSGLTGSPKERLIAIAGAMDWVLGKQQAAATKEADQNAKKKAHRLYADAVLALSKAFALASASREARVIRDEVAFFQIVQTALAKSQGAVAGSGSKKSEADFAVQQIISGAIVSTEIVDILKAAGMQSPDISILSDVFLDEIRNMERKNLALDALRKLINEEIRSQSKNNIVKQRSFSERLQAAINRYHNNAITTVQVIEELIGLAKDMKAARERGEKLNLSNDEVAFYDALADNESAQEAMGDDRLLVIAHELLESVRSNVGIDWKHSENARARIRVLVKRVLRKHGYPPDLEDAAVQLVIAQAETLTEGWLNS